MPSRSTASSQVAATPLDASGGRTFQALWFRARGEHADRSFLTFVDASDAETSWTYAEFGEVVDQVAGQLASRGVGRGDPVHLALRNCPAFVAIWLAAVQLGAWIVPVDPASTARDLTLQLNRTKPRVGVCAASRREVYAAASMGLLSQVIELTESVADLAQGSALYAAPAPPRTVEPDERLAVMFTSGTTSEPKGVELTQGNYHYVATVMSSVIGLEPTDRWFVTLPLFHANAQYYCIAPAIAVGAGVALTARFSASRWLAQAARLGVTHASLFASPIRMILAHRPTEGPAPVLRHVWYAQSLGQHHYEEFARLAGCQPRQLYGMTETTAIVTADLSERPRSDVIGRPVAGRAVLLLDPRTGHPVDTGVPGVITVRGEPGVDLFAGYLDDPETTARVLVQRNGATWLSTGDLAERDQDGVLRFVGRIDDVIKVSGENVSLTEVEAVLGQAPGVLEVAVLPRADLVRDHVPVAFVVPRDADRPPAVADLEVWAAEMLPPQSRPRSWTILSELPRTSVGKIRRFELQAQAEGSSSQTSKRSRP